MSREEESFIELISAYINQVNVDIYNDINWGEILELAMLHNLGGIIYASIQDKDIYTDELILNKLKALFISTIKYTTIQEIMAEKLIDLLNKNKIRHILFKGITLKRYYPNKELRTMGDVDIIIDSENQQEVHRILMENSFKFDELNSHKNVRNYEKSGVCFEIHTKLIEKNLFEDIDYVKYFENNFENANLVNKYTYEFKHEYHLVYLIVHMAKHFKNGGCGVRMFLDIAVFVKKIHKELDLNYVVKELEKLNLREFFEMVMALCNMWLNLDIFPCENKLSRSDLEVIAKYVIDGGVFGYNNRNVDAIRIGENNGNIIKRLINLTQIIFPSYEKMEQRYTWAENMPKYLLPMCWIRLWWFRVFVNKENSLKRIRMALENNDDAKKHTELMNMVGLHKK